MRSPIYQYRRDHRTTESDFEDMGTLCVLQHTDCRLVVQDTRDIKPGIKPNTSPPQIRPQLQRILLLSATLMILLILVWAYMVVWWKIIIWKIQIQNATIINDNQQREFGLTVTKKNLAF